MITVSLQRREERSILRMGQSNIKKSNVVEDYNQYMEGVDKSDQLVLYYGFAHRRVKWWERAFFHLMDLCLVNAHIIYKNHSTRKLTQLEFRTEVGKSLLDGYQSHVSQHFMSVDLPLLLTDDHVQLDEFTRQRYFISNGTVGQIKLTFL